MPLLERDVLVTELSRLVEEAFAGRGSVVAVVGEAGVGKTSLLAEIGRKKSANIRLLVTGCEALFTPRPLGPFYDIAARLKIDPDAPRETLFPTALDAVARVPTLLVVEDVHWADRATLDLLKYIARRIAALPLLLAISYRDDEVDAAHPLISLLGETAVKRLRVEPLSPRAVELLGGDRSLHEITGGNPFYVTEVLAHRGEAIPPTVRDAVLARAATLSPAARRVVEIASLMPGRAELSLIDANEEDIESATHSGIVRIEDGAIVFRHELGRRAIESSLSDVRRMPMHRAIFNALRAIPGTPLARLAHHALGARDAEAILRYTPLAAAEAAKADAHREAAAHYRNALSWPGALPDADRAELLESLAYECYLTEQLDEALRRREEVIEILAARGSTPALQLRIGDNLRWQSRILWFLARNAEARAKADEAIRVLEPSGETSELAMAYSNRAHLHMLAQENEQAIEWGGRAIAIAEKLGDNITLAHALNNVGVAEMQMGLGSAKLERSLQIALAGGYREHIARAYTNLASGLVRDAEYERALPYLDEGIAWSRERDLDSWVLYMSAWRARFLLETGRWREAEDVARSVLAHHGASAIARMPALAVLGRVFARRGNVESNTILDEARELALRSGEFQRIAPVAAARAEAAWLRGDIESIKQELAIVPNGLHEPWQWGDLAVWQWRSGMRTYDDVAEPYRLQISGHWREAAEAFAKAQRPYESAIALSDGDDPSSIQSAIATLERLGDTILVDRLRQMLRALGVRGPRLSTKAHPAGLTSRETEILQLLDEGLRNADIAARLFVSAKTVDHHVSSILAKLGAKSRGEAARIYRASK